MQSFQYTYEFTQLLQFIENKNEQELTKFSNDLMQNVNAKIIYDMFYYLAQDEIDIQQDALNILPYIIRQIVCAKSIEVRTKLYDQWKDEIGSEQNLLQQLTNNQQLSQHTYVVLGCYLILDIQLENISQQRNQIIDQLAESSDLRALEIVTSYSNKKNLKQLISRSNLFSKTIIDRVMNNELNGQSLISAAKILKSSIQLQFKYVAEVVTMCLRLLQQNINGEFLNEVLDILDVTFQLRNIQDLYQSYVETIQRYVEICIQEKQVQSLQQILEHIKRSDKGDYDVNIQYFNNIIIQIIQYIVQNENQPELQIIKQQIREITSQYFTHLYQQPIDKETYKLDLLLQYNSVFVFSIIQSLYTQRNQEITNILNYLFDQLTVKQQNITISRPCISMSENDLIIQQQFFMYLDEFVKYCPKETFIQVFDTIIQYVQYVVNNITLVNNDGMEFIQAFIKQMYFCGHANYSQNVKDIVQNVITNMINQSKQYSIVSQLQILQQNNFILIFQKELSLLRQDQNDVMFNYFQKFGREQVDQYDNRVKLLKVSPPEQFTADHSIQIYLFLQQQVFQLLLRLENEKSDNQQYQQLQLYILSLIQQALEQLCDYTINNSIMEYSAQLIEQFIQFQDQIYQLMNKYLYKLQYKQDQTEALLQLHEKMNTAIGIISGYLIDTSQEQCNLYVKYSKQSFQTLNNAYKYINQSINVLVIIQQLINHPEIQLFKYCLSLYTSWIFTSGIINQIIYLLQKDDLYDKAQNEQDYPLTINKIDLSQFYNQQLNFQNISISNQSQILRFANILLFSAKNSQQEVSQQFINIVQQLLFKVGRMLSHATRSNEQFSQLIQLAEDTLITYESLVQVEKEQNKYDLNFILESFPYIVDFYDILSENEISQTFRKIYLQTVYFINEKQIYLNPKVQQNAKKSLQLDMNDEVSKRTYMGFLTSYNQQFQ